MSATLDKIIEEVRALSPAEQQQLREMLNEETREQRGRLAQSIRGKYRDMLTSSEVFIAHKAEEIALEDRRR
jgi:hypothetical protein